MTTCRFCDATVQSSLHIANVAVADNFPLAQSPVSPDELDNSLDAALCPQCHLAQLLGPPTAPEQPLAVEPAALRNQSKDAVEIALSSGIFGATALTGKTVREFASPHGGSWLPLFEDLGASTLRVNEPQPTTAIPADIVIDSFGIMHEPDQQAAFARRAHALADGGVLLLQFHSFETIITHNQWTSFRHGHYGYYSLSFIRAALASNGLTVVQAWEFPLYGGSVLVAAQASSQHAAPNAHVRQIVSREYHAGVCDPSRLAALSDSIATDIAALTSWLDASDGPTFAYGAASRAVAILNLLGPHAHKIQAIADVSAAKQGRRMPGTSVEIISPEALCVAQPARVWLTIAELLPEVRAAYPAISNMLHSLT